MMNLYQIDMAMRQLIDEDGVITDEERFEELLKEKDTAVTGLSAMYLNLQAEADAIDLQIKRLQSLKDDNLKKQERYAEYIRRATGETSWCNEFINIKFTNTSRTVITDEKAIPKEYFYCPAPKPRPDKALIKKAIEGGIPVEGAEVVKYKSMSIK